MKIACFLVTQSQIQLTICLLPGVHCGESLSKRLHRAFLRIIFFIVLKISLTKSHNWSDKSPIYTASDYICPLLIYKWQFSEVRSLQLRLISPTAVVGSDARNLFWPSDTSQEIAQLVYRENSSRYSRTWVGQCTKKDCVRYSMI